MISNAKLSCAIAAILGGSSVGAAQAAPPANTETADSIQEITVTAQRRSENIQDVPISIQALTSETLSQLNVQTFDDFVKFVPNVTTSSTGPGQSNIYFRGLSVGVLGQQATGSVGPIPNAAVYLDEESVALPGRNLDVYAADLERIEVLEGPQGTLFGSGAEAGVLHYITNKPKLDVTEGVVNAGASYTAGGDPNTSVDATLNLPVIPDTLAVRGVIYSDRRGGYINNVPATFTRSAQDEGFRLNGYEVPTNSASINNNDLVQNDINPATYQGLRLSLLYKVNEDWNALLVESYQNLSTQGVFYQQKTGPEGLTFNSLGEPITGRPLAPLSVALFEPSYDKDRFENTALTVNGKIGDVKIVYAGSYLDRNIAQQQDYTNYARGVYAYYYQCTGLSKIAPSGTCHSPASVWRETEKNTHFSNEIRVTTNEDARARFLGGLYWEEYKIFDDTEYVYKTVPTCSAAINTDCFNNLAPRAGQSANDPNKRNDNVAFFDDDQRTIIQKAAFGSIDVDLVPKKLIFTAGTRYYRFDESELGGEESSFNCKVAAPATTSYFGPCLNPAGTNLNSAPYNNSTYHGFRSRGNLSYHLTDDVLLYLTYSQGFRPGGFNRGSFQTQPTIPGNTASYQYATPTHYAPDTLSNYEGGWKTEFFDHRLQINGAYYVEDWKNTIVELFAPQLGFGNLIFITNGPSYRVRGGELQVLGRVTDGFTVQAAATYNRSYETNSPALLNNNPASPNVGRPIKGVENVFGLPGSPLGQSPTFQGNIRARYEYPIGDYKTFAQGAAIYYGQSNSTVGVVNNYLQPGYATFDAAVGVAKDKWNVQFFSQNLGNKNASTYTNAFQFVLTETPLRPRIVGLKFGYKF
jgi:iron complex outermembrane receptor protein